MTRVSTWVGRMSETERSVFGTALTQFHEELHTLLVRMLTVIEDPESSSAERKRALSAVTNALFVKPVDATEEKDAQQDVFATRLRTLLQARGLSQQDLADRIDCSQPAVSQMLNRQCRPQKKTILRLAEALNVDPRELWPDLDVSDLLDAVASFQESDHIMTDAEAAALRDKSRKNRPTIPLRTLPKRHP